MRPWQTLSRRTVLSYGRFLTLESHTVQLPDGQVISEWPWLITPDYVNVLARTEEGLFLCFRQIKYAISGPSLAPVGGYLEPGEEPLAGAQRELLEETGYTASDWIDLGHFGVDGNRGAGVAYLFLARVARRVAQPRSDDLEEQHLLHLTRHELEAAMAAGQFKLLSWTAVVALALLYLDSDKS
jgi:8-oxo-dGTP pyrophosphatase MutT (NUDIX family)